MKSLDQLGFKPKDHSTALWCLFLMFIRPNFFESKCHEIGPILAMRACFFIYLNFFPYIIFSVFCCRYILFNFLLNTQVEYSNYEIYLWSFIVDLYGENIFGHYFLFFDIIFLICIVLFWGFVGFFCGFLVLIFVDVVHGFNFCIYLSIFYGFIFGISNNIKFISAEISIFIPSIICAIYFLNLNVILFYIFCVFPKLRPELYVFMPDNFGRVSDYLLPKLDQLITAYMESLKSEEIAWELSQVSNAHPAWGNAILKAKIRLIARATRRVKYLYRLDEAISGIPDVENGFLKDTKKLKDQIIEIASLQRRMDVQNRPFLKESESALLVEKIRSFQSKTNKYPEPLGSEFYQAADHWLEIAEAQHQQLRRVIDRQPQPQVFRAGDPVDREQEAFIPRHEVLGELDRQLSLATGCPGVILYGRRRMGKSTLLRNLDGFLPISVRVGGLSMQNPEASSSLEGWLRLSAEPARALWPEPERPAIPATLEDFFRLLDQANARLAEKGQRLLLAIDEYENLDRKLGEGVFPEDLLHTLRESIQTHRRIVWLFAGSHAIEELEHAAWPSYLISARTIEVPAFSPAETRLLLTEPMKHSRLFERDESKRPRFEPGFWGDNGIKRIQQETAGWPHLVQLLAETAVDLCNEYQRPSIDPALMEQAITKAVTAGDTVLRQLLRGESTEAEWAWLTGFRRRDALPIPDDEAVYRSLRRRWLVVEAGAGEWRLRVPLLQRWLRERG